MSDPFLDQESSHEDAEPRELFEIIVSSGVAYRVTSGTRDVVYDGKRYTRPRTSTSSCRSITRSRDAGRRKVCRRARSR
jgi:hypothetical protein